MKASELMLSAPGCGQFPLPYDAIPYQRPLAARAWQEQQLQALLGTPHEQQFFKALADMGRELGFDYCAYGLRLPFPWAKPRIVLFNNYPTAWQTRYRDAGYLAIDPTVKHGIRSVAPVVWSDALFASTPEFWEEARSFGLRFGWAESSRDASGIGGMLTLARSGEPLSEVELQAKGYQMAWLAQVAHLGLAKRLLPKLVPESQARLSKRETAVLCWTAEGKTAAEISTILHISERTVNFHIGNATIKLGAANKTAAVARAAMLGILC
ncbi:MAG TPA: autoinducer binding domain-containing protein [Candidatus Competibacter sp.]|nr:autoinducer binding domain-containing protein [Candidatus Competibacter sp.]HUM93542.1 autoinducer binding domain-containing protein [Candidatus Competibacter sp.]